MCKMTTSVFALIISSLSVSACQDDQPVNAAMEDSILTKEVRSIVQPETKHQFVELIDFSSLRRPQSITLPSDLQNKVNLDGVFTNLKLSEDGQVYSNKLYYNTAEEDHYQVNIESDGRRLYYFDPAASRDTTKPQIDEAAIIEGNEDEVANLMDLFGTLGSERLTMTRKLMRDTILNDGKKHNESEVSTEVLNHLVYVNRVIGGLPVLNNRMAFVFELNGRLQSFNGKWNQIDYGGSKLETVASDSEIASAVAEEVIARGFDPQKVSRIAISLVYIIEENCEGNMVANLKVNISPYTWEDEGKSSERFTESFSIDI